MNDPSGVHSAVLGMLSLSQQGMPIQGSGIPFYPQGPYQSQPRSTAYASHPTGLRAPGVMPPTPPRSPSNAERNEVHNNQNFPTTSDRPVAYTGSENSRVSGGYGQGYAPSRGEPDGLNQLGPLPHLGAPQKLSREPSQPIPNGWSTKTAVQNPILVRSLATTKEPKRKSRNEKKPIPAENKDSKYFEKRMRNNEAAKKSRDSRKHREEEIFSRAAYLERENAVLHAEIETLRQEAQNLAALIKHRNETRNPSQNPTILHHITQ